MVSRFGVTQRNGATSQTSREASGSTSQTVHHASRSL